jgi:hypothetical protein
MKAIQNKQESVGKHQEIPEVSAFCQNLNSQQITFLLCNYQIENHHLESSFLSPSHPQNKESDFSGLENMLTRVVNSLKRLKRKKRMKRSGKSYKKIAR